MRREYHNWHSPRIGHEMELLAFGHAGIPWLIFPTSRGRFFEFEDRGMVDALAHRIHQGQLQLYCVDSIDGESWYNKFLHPHDRVLRHNVYESYLLEEVVPLIRQRTDVWALGTLGCSLGGYHAMNFALRHPDVVTQCITMGAAFDMRQFLDGYYDEECYFNIPHDYLPNQWDPWYLDRYRSNWYLMATGEHDFCWNDNERLASIMRSKGINHRLDVWRDGTGHDWPWWHKMLTTYLG
jgi:esterase/lipase superfamily enzyme